MFGRSYGLNHFLCHRADAGGVFGQGTFLWWIFIQAINMSRSAEGRYGV
jgi:hypothetical protein